MPFVANGTKVILMQDTTQLLLLHFFLLKFNLIGHFPYKYSYIFQTGIEALAGLAEEIDPNSSIFIVDVSMKLSPFFPRHYNMEVKRPISPKSHQPTIPPSDDITKCIIGNMT